MKTNSNKMGNTKTNARGEQPMQHDNTGKHQRPQNKDDMDSRANEEYDLKGDDVTHNKKNTKEDHLHKHRLAK